MRAKILPKKHKTFLLSGLYLSSELFFSPIRRVSGYFAQPGCRDRSNGRLYDHAGGSSRLLASMFTVASRFRRLKFVGSYLSTIEAVGTGSWLSVVQVLLDVSIALLVAIIEFHGGIQRDTAIFCDLLKPIKRYPPPPHPRDNLSGSRPEGRASASTSGHLPSRSTEQTQ